MSELNFPGVGFIRTETGETCILWPADGIGIARGVELSEQETKRLLNWLLHAKPKYAVGDFVQLFDYEGNPRPVHEQAGVVLYNGEPGEYVVFDLREDSFEGSAQIYSYDEIASKVAKPEWWPL